MKLHSISIDVTKIDKSRLYVGKKGTYLKLTIAEKDEPDQFGNNLSAWEEQTEEERKNKTQRNFLGNGKTIWTEKPANEANEASDNNPDDLPF